MALNEHLDLPVIRSGAAIAAAVAVPAALIGQAVVGDDTSDDPGWYWVFPAAVLAGLLLGAAIAAWAQRRGTPLLHGITVAVGVFVVVQVVGVLRRAFADEEISWSRVVSSALLSAMAGTLGGLLGSWLAVRRPPGRHAHPAAEK